MARTIDVDKRPPPGSCAPRRHTGARRSSRSSRSASSTTMVSTTPSVTTRRIRSYLKAGDDVRWGEKGVRMRPDGTLEIVGRVGRRAPPPRSTARRPGLAFALARLTWETASAVPRRFRLVVRRSTRISCTSRCRRAWSRRARRGPRGPAPRRRHLDDRLTRLQRRSSSTRSSTSAAVTRAVSCRAEVT